MMLYVFLVLNQAADKRMKKSEAAPGVRSEAAEVELILHTGSQLRLHLPPEHMSRGIEIIGLNLINK